MHIQGNTKILGIGGYVPDQRVTSEELLREIKSEQRFGLKETFIGNVLGIYERRVAANENPSDMAIRASEVAIADAGVDPLDIDMVVFCGIERDWQEPSTAHRVQNVLGAHRAVCFDISNACHGFMNGLSVADAMISNGSIETALVCTGEKPSIVMYDTMGKLEKSNDREYMKTQIGGLTVGDAGGAMVVTRAQKGEGIRYSSLQSRGEYAELCYYTKDEHGIAGVMDMPTISAAGYKMHESMMANTYERLRWAPADVDYLICHQVGIRHHKQLISLAKIAPEKAPITFNLYGNITSATIPYTLFLNPPEKGKKVLILGSGSGLSVSQTGIIM